MNISLARDLNLILSGYSELNKPRVGRGIAERLNMTFVDVREQVEHLLDKDLESVREKFGERRVAVIENDVMDGLVLRRGAVIRVNATTLVSSERRQSIMRTGFTACLTARLDALLQRSHITLGARYHDPAMRGEVLSLLRRESAVFQLDGVERFDVTDNSEREIIERLVAWWQTVAVVRG